MPRRPIVVALVAAGSLITGLVTGPAAFAAGPTPQLLRIHVFYPASNAAHGKPQPTTANCSPDGATQNQYGLTGWKDTARSATLVTRTIPTTIRTGTDPLNGPTGTASSSEVQSAMQDAFNAWSRADSRAPSITVAADATSTQKRQSADRTDELLFARVSGNAIAVTYTWRWSDGLIESDTVFSNTLGWAIIPDTDPTAGGCYLSWPWYDVANIATHEFGHTYGLDDLRSDRFETMYGYGYTGETLKRSPADGDTTGLRSIY
jgi:hypothetical protein